MHFTVVSTDNEHALCAQTPPDYPVMVVSINERTDEDGNVTFGTLALPIIDDGGGGGGGTDPPPDDDITEKKIYFEWFRATDYMEPKYKGDPEFRMLFATNGRKLEYRWGGEYGHWHLFYYHYSIDEGDANQKSQYLFTWTDKLGDYVGAEFWEVDAGIFNSTTKITIPIEIDSTSYGSFTAEWDVKSADDKLGENELLYVGGNPLFSDRSYIPPENEMYPAGVAFFTLWWE